jgi:hypothetical protein
MHAALFHSRQVKYVKYAQLLLEIFLSKINGVARTPQVPTA